MFSVFRAAVAHPSRLAQLSAQRFASKRQGAPVLDDADNRTDEIADLIDEGLDPDSPETSDPSDLFAPGPIARASATVRFKSFNEVQFTKPQDYSVTGRSNIRHPLKRPQIGPGAAQSKRRDPFYQLNLDPLNECMNRTLLSAFVTEMGKIMGRAETGLTWRNQRRVSKAIRRAKMMGVIPMLSRVRYNRPK